VASLARQGVRQIIRCWSIRQGRHFRDPPETAWTTQRSRRLSHGNRAIPTGASHSP
jgi:hypothetical protein